MDNPQMFDLMPPLLRNKKDVLFGNMAEIYEFHNKYVIAKFNFLVILIFQKVIAGWWWCTPLIPALGRQKEMDFSVFQVNLVHLVSFRTARAI
jgi:hypothetical protein